MTIRVVIADDERPARQRVTRLLAHRADYQVVAEADSGPEAAECIRRERPDLVVLDLQMPGCGGLEALRMVEPGRCPVVAFVTSFDQDAIDLLESTALGYLLKPYSDERFEEVLRQVTRVVAEGWGEMFTSRVRSLLARVEVPRSLERFAVRDADRVRMVGVNAVDWIEAAADYVKLHVGDQRHLVRMTMQALEERLDRDRFLRVHRSAIVRVDRVARLEAAFSGEDLVVLADETPVRVGRTYRRAVRERLEGRLRDRGGVFFSPARGRSSTGRATDF